MLRDSAPGNVFRSELKSVKPVTVPIGMQPLMH